MTSIAPIRPALSIAALLLVASGCPRNGQDRAADTAASPRPSAGANAAVCLQGEEWTASGAVPLQRAGAGDANRISALRWEPHDGCERFVIDLARSGDAPAASTGEVRAQVMRSLGVVRVSLMSVPEVDTGATDATFDGRLARAAYSVWSPEGRWTFVDLHLAGEAEAHIMALSDPARVVVDLRPGGGSMPARPATSRRVVVLQPQAGEARYPLEVTGYARTFEANVVVRLSRDGNQVHESFTTATAWVDAWGHYSLTIPSGPTGPVRLHVGEYSARDGEWEGVAIDLTMR